MKFLNKFYNRANIPWVQLTWDALYRNTQTPPHARCPVGSFWWKDILKLADTYKQFTTCVPAKGNSVMIWKDPWSANIIKDQFPELFSFTRKPKCSINYFLTKEVETIFLVHYLYRLLNSW